MMVYIVWHEYEYLLDGVQLDNESLIGIYSSPQKAEEVVQKCKGREPYKEYPDNFCIDKYEVDKCHWTDGFIIPEE